MKFLAKTFKGLEQVLGVVEWMETVHAQYEKMKKFLEEEKLKLAKRYDQKRQSTCPAIYGPKHFRRVNPYL